MKILTIIISFITGAFYIMLLFLKGFKMGKKDVLRETNEKTLEEIKNVTKDKNYRDNDDIDDVIDRVCSCSHKKK